MTLKDVELTVDEQRLATIDEDLLKHLVAAADALREAFLKQAYHGNEDLLKALRKRGEKELLERVRQNAGPFERADHDKPFIEGHKKPKGAGFYPEDLTREEWDTYIKEHPEQRAALESPYTIITREGETLKATPYHEAYEKEVAKAAKHLRAAAKKAEEETLKAFLEARAKALETDEYYESELLWMDVRGAIEVTIGPYEVYEDALNGTKTSYEAFIGLVDEEATAEVAHLEEQAPLLEEHLPLSEKHRNTGRGTHSPIRIVEELHSAGDCEAGIHFTAYNLPNDERVREAKGSKKVMIRNVARAKYEHCWVPLVERTFTAKMRSKVSFEDYFLHVLLHEISHGLGPGIIEKEGRSTTVSAELKETYPTLEEAKADLLGVHNAFVLANKGVLEEKQAWGVLHSFVAGTIRSIRFGTHEAHGAANSIALNWLLRQGAVAWQVEKLGIRPEEAKEALFKLLEKILIIQAKGNYEAAQTLIEQYREPGNKVRELLERLEDIPIDIHPLPPLGK